MVEWQAKIDAWEKDKTLPNPYLLDGQGMLFCRSPFNRLTVSTVKNPTEAKVRADLKKEEAEEALAGKTPLHGTTAAAFLALGLQIETLQ